jgi:glycosyltransferase involved in cell wall biosynthesis
MRNLIGWQNQKRRRISVAMVMRIFSAKGGLELYTHKLIEGLLAQDCQVTVFCEEWISTFTHPHLSVIQLETPDKAIKKRERLEYYFREFSRLVQDHGPFDIINSQQVSVENVDVAHFHNPSVERMSRNGKWWESMVNRFKLQVVPSYKERDKYDRLLATKASVLIFPSLASRRDFETTYSLLSVRDSASHMVAYPGVDPLTINAEPFVNRDNCQPINFLFVGKGFRKKGLDVLFSACRILAKSGYAFTLSIVGLRAKPLDQIRLSVFGLSKQVKYLGFQNDMASVYANAQAIAFPSRIDAFGMAPLEAMRYGVVPIVSRVSGVSEILTHGKDGLILEDHLNAKELAGLMASLIKDQAKTAALSQQARLTAAKYRWTDTVGVILNGYATILQANQRKPGGPVDTLTHSINPII